MCVERVDGSELMKNAADYWENFEKTDLITQIENVKEELKLNKSIENRSMYIYIYIHIICFSFFFEEQNMTKAVIRQTIKTQEKEELIIKTTETKAVKLV